MVSLVKSFESSPSMPSDVKPKFFGRKLEDPLDLQHIKKKLQILYVNTLFIISNSRNLS